MAAGDKTTKYTNVTLNEKTGVINYAEQTFIEDSDGNLHAVGKLHRPGQVVPSVKDSNDDWVDNDISNKPQFVRDMATALWNDTRKSAYQNNG